MRTCLSQPLNNTRFPIQFAVLSLLGAVLFAVGCDTRVEESPTEIVELRAERSISSVGGDPADWVIEGSCVGMGSCRASAHPVGFPELEASSTYTVRDSRAFPRQPDGIEEAARRAVDGGCFDRVKTARALRECLG